MSVVDWFQFLQELLERFSRPVQDWWLAMSDVTKKKGDVAEVARVLNWRKQNPERYRAYQRELMRKRREKNRVSVPADPES